MIVVTIADASGKINYDGALLASIEVTAANVAEVAVCARARWKIENESFNVLKDNGYHLPDNFGHGKENLAMVFAGMNLPPSPSTPSAIASKIGGPKRARPAGKGRRKAVPSRRFYRTSAG
ncbi:MAG: hypothetical protein ABSE69_05080 [Roseiarcus sp.]